MSNSPTPKTSAALLVAVMAIGVAGCGDDKTKDSAPDPNAAPPAPLATGATGGSAKDGDNSGAKGGNGKSGANANGGGSGATDNPGNPAGPGPGDEDRLTGVKIALRDGKFASTTPKKVSVMPWIRVSMDISALDDKGYRLTITQHGKKQVKKFPEAGRRIITTEPPEPDSTITLSLGNGQKVRIKANLNPGP